MKKIFTYIIFVLATLIIFSCEKDITNIPNNFDTVDCIGDSNSNLFKKIMNNIVKTL